MKNRNNISYKAAICGLLLIILAGCGGSKKGLRPQNDIYGSRAYSAFLEGDLTRSVELYKKGFAAARKGDHQHKAAQNLSNIGRVYFELGRLDSAVLYLTKSHEEFVWAADTAAASRAAAFLAFCHAAQGSAQLSDKWFTTASAYKGKNNEHYNAVIKGRIDLLLKSKISDEAALEKAAAFYKKKKEFSSLTTINILKSQAESHKGSCSEANRLLLEALGYVDKSGEDYRRAAILLNLSALNFCAKNNDAAKHYYARAADCAPKGIIIPSLSEISASCNGRVCK
ncbi:MAG: tetratricopeptide repeat protein [Chitinispirillales bacterium]|jgi:tetratricopeptide (TPR) repeat protein|nr:tetratricopeptide repeat protein [Chitinispirillales bacterium]